MKRLLLTAAVAATLCLLASSAGSADNLVTGPVDQAGFQALLDAASPGDTIYCLGGIYDFGAPGPLFLDKGLRIVAYDDEDPPLFVGDGTFFTPFPEGNNGFVQEEGSYIEGLTIQGLHFQDFDRTIVLGNAYDSSTPNCPLIPGAGGKNVRILDNTIRDTRRGIQVIGGPLEDFVFEGNDIEALLGGYRDYGIGVFGGLFDCDAGGFLTAVRPVDGTIEDNHVVAGANPATISAFGVVDLSVEENRVEGGFFSIWIGDSRAFSLPDDGPIPFGTVEENIIDGAFVGIVVDGPTTMTDAKIEDNQINGGFIGVALQLGANGFKVEENEFSEIVLAEIYLGYDESGGIGEFPPDTFNNKVEAEEGDRVFDFGVNNEVEIDD